MFKQTPHPFYLNVLNHPYKIISSKDEYCEWICEKYTFLIFTSFNRIELYDPESGQKSVLQDIKINDPINIPNITQAVEKYISKIKKSLDIKSIELMDIILCEMVKKYPNINSVHFILRSLDLPSRTGKNFLNMMDDKSRIYSINIGNLYDDISEFYFISNMHLRSSKGIKKFTNHQLIEHFAKAEDLKEKLNVNIEVELLS